MSLFAAMTVAVGGLNAQASAIGNISDNLANASTTGYKRVDTKFEALVTQSGVRFHNPGGVLALPYYQNSLQGNLIPDSTATSLAISGAGFFPVRPGVVGADGLTTFGGTTYFTRAGDFTLNAEGYLVNNAGFYLTGYSVSNAGLVDTSSNSPIHISELLDNPVATSLVKYAANLPAGAAPTDTFAPSNIQIYDALGVAHDMSLVWTNTGTSTWDLTITIPNGVDAGGGVFTDYTATVPFTFNDATNPGTIASIGAGSGNFSILATPQNNAQISLPLSFAGAGAQTMTVDFGTYNTSTGVTQFADTAISVSTLDQNGIPRGAFQSLSIDNNGFVSLNYDNGRTRIIAQIPVVQFFAPDQLQRITGGAFAQTLGSGTARFGVASTNGAGSIQAYTLEGSNVDIADEFTKMITAQQVYSANAKTITTSNDMMQTVINIIR